MHKNIKKNNEQMTLKEYLDLSKSQQKELAAMTGFCCATISRWLSGERMPSRRAIEKIHNATKGAVTWTDWVQRDDRR